MGEYRYTPLLDKANEIRLVTLLPGLVNDPITIEIDHTPLIPPSRHDSGRFNLSQLRKSLPSGWRVWETLESKFLFASESDWKYTWSHPDESLDKSCYELSEDPYGTSEPAYEALSYTWGPVEETEIIHIKSKPQSGTPSNNSAASILSVGRNLGEALRYLRYTDVTRTLWIDAICINQGDEVERGHQVNRMADIYSYARRVVIWLGPASTTSRHALTILSYIGKEVEFSKDYALLGVPGTSEDKWHQGGTPLPYNDDTYAAIAELIQRPWFSRLWIIQEAQLANPKAVIQCGNDQMTWNLFSRAVHCLMQKSVSILNRPLNELLFLLVPSKSFSFSTLVYRFSTQQCSDGRDRVYALLGLVEPDFRRKIRPQYSDSVGKVFQDSFLACLHHFRRMEFLSYCYSSPRLVDAPTWVPDLTAPRPVNGRLGNQLSAGYSAAEVTFQPPDRLEVTGTHCYTVNFVTSACPRQPQEALVHAQRHAPEIMHRIRNPAQGDFLDAFARTLAVDGLHERFPNGVSPTLESWKADTQRGIIEKRDLSSAGRQHFNGWCEIMLSGRPFFTTNEGTFGLGAPGMEPGKLS